MMRRELEALQARFPIDPGNSGLRVSEVEYRSTLPTRLDAKRRRAWTRECFRSYTAEYRQNGTELHVFRRKVGATGIQPPDVCRISCVASTRGHDDTRMIVLERTAPTRP